MSGLVKPANPVLNRAHPLAQGLVFDSCLHEGSGNKTFDTVNRLQGDNASSGAVWETGNYGYNLFTNVAGSKVTFTTPPPVNDLSGPMSFHFRFQRGGVGGGNFGRVWVKGAERMMFYHDNNNPGALEFLVDRATDGKWRTATTAVSLNTWYDFVLTYDGSSVDNDPIFYLNGVSIAVTETSTPVGAFATDNSNLYLLNRAGTDRAWNGRLSYLRIYNRILFKDEAASLSAHPFQIYKKQKLF